MNRSLIIAIVLAVVAVGWVLSGSSATKEVVPETHPSDSETAEKFKVKVKTIVAESVTNNLYLQGQIEAVREIEIKAEVKGVVTQLGSEKGSRLKKGERIVELDVSDRLAKLKKAKAELAVKRSEKSAGAQLQKKSMLSVNQQQQNVADVLAAEAAVKEIEVEINKTLVKAPFDTVLNERYVEIGDYVSPGDPLAYLVDDSTVIISADIPQQYIAKLSIGQTVKATLLDGRTLEGKINFISSSANPKTRAFRMEARAENNAQILRFGQSARVTVETGTQKAHQLTASLLDLNSEGGLQVKGVNTDGRVVTQRVDIIRSERNGVWLKGLPDRFRIITVGQGFVNEGDAVETIEEEGTTGSVTL